MSNHTSTQTHTLPATGHELPAGLAEYTVKAYKSMMTANGLADTGNLYRGGTLVGSIHGDDNGGQTYLRPESMDEHQRFVDACGEQTEESVLNALMLDTLAARELNKETRKGHLVFTRAGADQDDQRVLNMRTGNVPLSDVKNMLAKDHFQQGLAKKFGDGARFWDTEKWVTVTA